MATAESKAIGYVIVGSEGCYLHPQGYWRNVPLEQAWVHAKEDIGELNRLFELLGEDKPQAVFEAYREEGKTRLFTGIAMPFAMAVENNMTAP